MAYYLVLTWYVVAQSLHGCLYCTVVPLCKLFNYRHHKHASFKQTNKKSEYGYLWSVMKHSTPSKYFRHHWAFHFLRCSMADECSRGKKIPVNFWLYSKPVSYQNEDADARGVHWTAWLLQHWMLLLEKWFSTLSRIKIQGAGGTNTVTTACLATCSLIISHNKKGTGL